MIINIITGFLSGIISGMGIGGGAILIPALVIFEKIGQKIAQGINLAYFIPTAIISLYIHIKKDRVERAVAFVIGGFGIIGAIAGACIATTVKGDFLRRGFGIFLLFIGIHEIYKGLKT